MRAKLNKNLYRAILILTFLAVNAMIIFGISSVWGFLNTGASRSSMLHTEIKSRRMYLPEVVWDTSAYKGRTMEAQSLQEIERDYLNGWYVKNLALQSNKPFGIEDYYTDSARVNLYNIIDFNESRELSFTTTTTNHYPRLLFYSADGQLVVFKDRKVRSFRQSFISEELIDEEVDTASYKVMMLLEDGFWRVRHIQQITSDFKSEEVAATPGWHIQDDEFYVQNQKFQIKGMNYYPQDTPWDMYGDNFNLEVITSDFKVLKNQGLNTLRLFVPYEDFGKAGILPAKLDKLRKVMDAANSNDLKVILTLFDFYGDYSVLDWTLTQEHARQVIRATKDHPALLAWDLKNEPDLDFESRGEQLVKAWLKEMASQVRRMDPGHPITIGWSSAKTAENLLETVDLVSYHFYEPMENFETSYQALQEKVSKPVVVQEYGLSSYNGLWNPLGADETEQADYHQYMQKQFASSNIHYVSWTLYDFPEIPSDVAGSLPWRKKKQTAFGFIDIDGNRKPSFEFLQ
ncbi:glycoside hydrolase family 2 TIM barrel-domain containing protein [Christiangramia portivictoriae]|uniref:glycoside hydrolase family 2 TIM barrel-domain containing protein n=1 Tax=Christiangramia portivictoriae TaxID=326069 RepID=UPI0004026A04|nr:glycoside hydrolase family 2 TIM barrel-domain containing protein [Christiangramia portivictoriae]